MITITSLHLQIVLDVFLAVFTALILIIFYHLWRYLKPPSLPSGETVVFKIRKHWLTIAATGLGFLGLAFLPLLIERTVGFSFSFLPIKIDTTTVPHLSRFLYLLWLLTLGVGFFAAWTDYYLDVWFITTERIIDVEQKGFFNRDEATVRLENIQDITSDVRGVFATVFDFGDLRVQSAGEKREFLIENAAHPEAVKLKIEELQNQALSRRVR